MKIRRAAVFALLAAVTITFGCGYHTAGILQHFSLRSCGKC